MPLPSPQIRRLWSHTFLADLSLEDLSLSFQALSGDLQAESLPDNLQTLQMSDWEVLADLLLALQGEQRLSTVH
jgi:hypothetical protein